MNHSQLPAPLLARRVSQWTLFREWLGGVYDDIHGHLWFWAVCLAAFVWLAYVVVKWAVAVPSAMRIGL